MPTSGNEGRDALLPAAMTFFKPLAPHLLRFAEEVGMQAEPYPKSEAQWDFRGLSKNGWEAYIMCAPLKEGFLVASSWQDPLLPVRMIYRIPPETFRSADPEYVVAILRKRLLDVVQGLGEVHRVDLDEKFPRDLEKTKARLKRLPILKIE